MKLLWCCFLAAFAISNAVVDVEKTVQQVQNILSHNMKLPRLSRDEIIQLLNDIKAEDAKSAASKESKENIKSTSTEGHEPKDMTVEVHTIETYEQDSDNEIKPNTPFVTEYNEVLNNASSYERMSVSPNPVIEISTKSSEPNVMVVLPYTPRDGFSLQELYTRPPRVEVVPASQIVPEGIKKSTTERIRLNSNEKIKETFTNNAKIASQNKKQEMPPELQAFLNAHGLTGKAGNDHFLLPLEGFKPLPPAKVVDGSVQLPENILLTYDLIPSESGIKSTKEDNNIPPSNVMYEPLHSGFPFELDSSASESLKTVLPLDLPKSRQKKTTNQPNYDPIDYDSVRVIPLQVGPKPEDNAEKATLENELSKRQIENVTLDSNTTTSSAENSTEIVELTTAAESDFKDLSETSTSAPKDLSASDSDAGASIADLEDSFGGAAPSEPGDSMLPPQRKNGFYWMLDLNKFLEVGDGDTKVNIRFEPKLGDPQMFLPVSVP